MVFDMKIASLYPPLLAFFILLSFLAPIGAAATTPAETIVTTSVSTTNNDPSLLIDYKEIKREISLGEMGRVHLSDSYHIANKAEDPLRDIKIFLS